MFWAWLGALALSAPFSRVAEGEDAVALELATRSYAHEDGTVVHLVGVAHIGLPSFYAVVDGHLRQVDRVLYEGVGGEASREGGEHVGLNGAYARLADGLGLVFQLDALDYSADNWVNSDLSIDELRSLSGEADAAAGQVLRGGREVRKLEKLASRASRSPLVRVMARVMLIESLPRVEDAMEQTMGAEVYQALIVARNDRVFEDLQGVRGQSVAVLYGAAHLRDLEERVLADGFRPTGEAWTPVIDASADLEGVSAKLVGVVRAKVVRRLDKRERR